MEPVPRFSPRGGGDNQPDGAGSAASCPARRGWLCVLESIDSWSEPVRFWHYWPVLRATEHAAAVDYGAPQRLQVSTPNVYSATWPGTSIPYRLALIDGGATKPIKTTVEPIPPPKGRRSVRWHAGPGRD